MKTISAAVAVAAALAATPVVAQAPVGDVRVLVTAVHEKGEVVYRYQVRNDSASAIDYLVLGRPEAGKELPATPWKQNPLLSDVPSAVPKEQCTAFKSMTCEVALYSSGWAAEPKAVLQMRGNELYAPAASGFAAPELIKAGTSSTVALVRVPARAAAYMTVPATVGLYDRQPRDEQGRAVREVQVALTKTDVTPPELTGSAAVEKAGALLDVRVSLQVKDAVDPEPEVRLVSVTANQPMQPKDVQAGDLRRMQLRPVKGRIYSLTYSAIDASENSAQLVIQVAADPR